MEPGAAIGISVSVVMFGTILAGVLLGMAINIRRIILMLIVGATCFYAVSYASDYKNTIEDPNIREEPLGSALPIYPDLTSYKNTTEPSRHVLLAFQIRMSPFLGVSRKEI